MTQPGCHCRRRVTCLFAGPLLPDLIDQTGGAAHRRCVRRVGQVEGVHILLADRHRARAGRGRRRGWLFPYRLSPASVKSGHPYKSNLGHP